jgi:hypothetical protein
MYHKGDGFGTLNVMLFQAPSVEYGRGFRGTPCSFAKRQSVVHFHGKERSLLPEP